ncbi:MAG TPA: translocation/assembly module TamB domain-containing protein [Bryobacteraceae bacterium]|nr:translocation/assembly module TamB domain-containing protein [Bryobacteraceae bacterium]
MTRRAKIAAFSFLGAVALVLAVCVAGVVLLQSEWFKNKVREKIVSVTERATGGRVDIGAFSYNWRALTAEVYPFVLHGTEGVSAPPLFRADKIRVHLKIISLFEKKVDIASLVFDRPSLNISVAPDGSTNVPRPKFTPRGRALVERLLDLKVQHIEVHHGQANYNSWKFPVDAAGEGVQVSLRYESAGPRYICTIASPDARIASPNLQTPAEFAIDSQIAFSTRKIQILSADLSSGGMKLHAAGDIMRLSSPQADLEVNAVLPMADLSRMVRLPIEPRGEIDFQGHANAATGAPYQLSGQVTGRDLGYSHQGVDLSGISLSTRAEVNPDLIRLADLDVSSAQGRFRGAAQLADFERLSLQGTIGGVSIAEVGRLARKPTGGLSGTLSGPVQLDGVLTASGLARVKTNADLVVTPGQGGAPVEGTIAVNYDQRTGKIALGNSLIALGASQASLSGTLGETLAVHAVSRNLDDAIPVLRALGATPPPHWPVRLRDGVARIDATVSGSLKNAQVSGKADVERLRIDGHQIDHIATTFKLDSSSANLLNVSVQEGQMRLEGQASAGLRNWKLETSNPISALATLRSADLQTLFDETGMQPLPAGAGGTISATLRVTGSLDTPLVTGNVTLENLTAYNEHFSGARAAVTFTPTSLELSNGVARNGTARIALSGVYNHPARDWNDGSLRFDVSTSGLDLTQIQHVQEFETGLRGRVELKANGAAKIVDGRIDLTSLSGHVAVRNAAIDGHSYGDLEVTAATRLPMLTLTAEAMVQNYRIQGSGEWRMEGDYRGEAHVVIPRISFATLHDLAPGKHVRKDLPFAGFLEGDAAVTGPLNHPSLMKASVTLSTVQFNAPPGTRPLGNVQPQDLVLRNQQPIHLEAAGGILDIGHASFIAKDTILDAAGRVALNSKSPWDLNIQGRINFSILELFNPDLLGSGASNIKVAIRGPLLEPQVDGRLELRNVSLFLRNVPTGIDQANGLILFDRNRATIQNLTAQTGGGDIKFETGSFIGFRGEGLVYRLQGAASNVRYRSGNGVSLTMDGTLALVGTSENSVLSGTVSVIRAGFSPQTDLGALLASTAKPVAEATPNDYLNGMQLDVHVVTNHTLEVDTALTRNIQADADVRLRGTTDRPVLLGDITVNSGQIEFFGNKYTINRGEINFSNPARIEPNIDMDLSTRVRGITVDITFSGSLNNLNFSYRSDPPLEASDIIALLAVGRAPAAAGPLASPQTANNLNSSYLGTGNNSLLSQAIAPNQGRLQKFFGVSHIKIDPQLNDITIVPQARLTMEQQVSSDITLTYITNLAITNQQIVRVEWDFSRKWSAVALRDENGAFSIDIQYRKRFK